MCRPTKMLTTKELQEDLKISDKQVAVFVSLKILNPIFLGKGWRFSQEEVLQFQKKYRGMDLSNAFEAKKAKEKLEKLKETN